MKIERWEWTIEGMKIRNKGTWVAYEDIEKHLQSPAGKNKKEVNSK